MYDSQSIPLLSTGIGTAVSQPHPCCHSISLLLLLLASHSQLSAAACCLLLLVCLSASIPPYSPTVVLRYNATFSQEEHLFGHSELSFAALMLWLGAIRCSSRLPIQRRRLFGAEIKS